MNEKQFIESQKDCANMLGMSLGEYENFCKNLKVPNAEQKNNREYDNSILKHLGLKISDLKLRKGN